MDIITKYGLQAATNGYISPVPPPVKVRMAQKDAKAILLCLPRTLTLTVELGPPHFAGEIVHKLAPYRVDATCKSLGAGVHELTFFIVDWPPTTDSDPSPPTEVRMI